MKARRYPLAIFAALIIGSLAVPATAFAQDTYREAFQEYQRGNYAQAERLFRQVVEEFPEWGWAHMMLGISIQKRGGSARAALNELETAKEMVDKDEERFMVNDAIAQVRLVQGSYDAAISAEREAEKYAQSGEQRARIAGTLGKAYYYMGQWQNAVRNLEAAARARSADANIQAMLGRSYFERSDKSKALDSLNKAIQLDRGNRLALYFAALIHLEDKDYQQAVRIAERAVRADPQDTAIRSMLGRAYLGAQRFDEAAQAFEIVITDKRTDGGAHYNLGQAYQFSERYPRAIESYTEALKYLAAESAPRGACLYDLGFCYEKTGNFEDSLQAFKDSAEIDSSQKVTEAIARVEERIRRAKSKGGQG